MIAMIVLPVYQRKDCQKGNCKAYMQGLGTSIKDKVIAAHMNKNAFLQVAPKAKQAIRFPLEIKLISRQPYFIVQCHNKILTR